MIRNIACALFTICAVFANSTDADIVEEFNHPLQSDTTGATEFGELFYRITTTGTYGSPTDLIAASFGEGLASGASVVQESTNRFGRANAAAGSGFLANSEVLLGIFDVPGLGDTDPGGVFGDFFSGPKDLSGAFGSVDLRQFSGATTARARFIAFDNIDNEIATSTFGLSSGSFTNHGFVSTDFTDGDAGFDETAVIGVGVEFFVDADATGNTGAYVFDVDNFSLTAVPEPCSTIVFAATVVVGVTRRRRV